MFYVFNCFLCFIKNLSKNQIPNLSLVFPKASLKPGKFALLVKFVKNRKINLVKATTLVRVT